MQSLTNSYDLLKFLKEQNLIKKKPTYWWPSSNDFEILVGAILTQNTKWINVEKSLESLKKLNYLTLENLANSDIIILTNAIAPSGFKNQKAKRLKLLCKNIIHEFGSFEYFQKSVSSSWLLAQKGIGQETKDAIMCYACHQDYMVVDKYIARLLKRFNYEFDTYDDIQTWLVYGINENFDKIKKLYGYEISLNEVYCRFHGKIVEFMKRNPKD
ncbi:3-methyladenine DNA glycosylase [Malaciobacter molluscorum]|uniref:3-methyladenine DNA glycosylase n=1 Tax=Malaciobacter molluscorum TaxID=1032072 RepID=UPI00100ACA33|nr:3-methyladenine DNA glycosylase [Malaciobacter molluscorum]RXJ93387.1 3-methyladenine DNA glycosylase [Malaciobacter molluscorum]